VLLLDLAPVDGRAPEEQCEVLLDELRRYQPDLLDRPRLVVANKTDVATTTIDDHDALVVSAVTHAGLDEFLGQLGVLVDEARAAEPVAEPFVVLRPVEEGFTVERDDDGGWRIAGRGAERVVAMADLTNIEALEYVQQRLRKMGVERALARAGAREGDVVRIGPVEFEYVEGLG
jgi:GTP-binding protein